jgi:hypothetical protein
MVTLSFSVPDDVGEAFAHVFEGMDQNAVIAELMRKAVADIERNNKELQRINACAEELNREAEDVLDYQVLP